MEYEEGMSGKEVAQSTVEIVKAYVAGNVVAVEELPRLVEVVRGAVSELDRSPAMAAEKASKPAVAIGKSVKRNHIVCLEDGRKFKSLKRHLRVAHGQTPDEYRAKWGLEDHYPMVAAVYSARRAELAHEMGLGRKPGRRRGRSASGKSDAGHLTDAA